MIRLFKVMIFSVGLMGHLPAAFAQSWANLATSGSLDANELCYSNGTDIICDGPATFNGATALDISGTIKISNGGEACAAPIAGGLRYNTGSSQVEFCDGTAWINIALSGGGSSLWSQNASDIYYSTGNIGVGVTAPLSLVHAKSTAGNHAAVTIDTTDTNRASTMQFNKAGSTMWYLSNRNEFDAPNNRLSLIDSTGANELVTFLQNGRVGIGTNTPTYALDVSGTGEVRSDNGVGGAYLFGTSADEQILSNDNDDVMTFWTNGNENLRIDANGNIGVGTTSPNYRVSAISTPSQIHIGNSSTDEGGFLTASGSNNVFMSGGASWNGTNWVAKDAASATMGVNLGVLKFYVDSGLTVGNTFTPTERMRILSSGHVGIGTTAPNTALEVSGTVLIGNGGEVCDPTVEGALRYNAGTSTVDFCDGSSWVNVALSGGGSNLWSQNGSDVYYTTGGVAVGSTSLPTHGSFATQLDVAGADNAIMSVRQTNALGGTEKYSQITLSNGTTWFGANDRSYQMVNQANVNGTADYRIQYWDGTGYNAPFTITAAGNVGVGAISPTSLLHVKSSSSAMSGIITLENDNGVLTNLYTARSALPHADKAVLENTNGLILNPVGGNVGIGTQTASELLEVAGNVKAVSFINNSDRKLKKNIETLDAGLEKVLALRGVRYDFKQDVGKKLPQGEQIGLIAQEVESVLPEVVHDGADGYKSVNYAALVAPLIEAVKEQQAQIDALKAEVERLKVER